MCGGGGSDPKELESKKALAQQAANALRRYGETFVPLENMFIDDTKAMFAEAVIAATWKRCRGRGTCLGTFQDSSPSSWPDSYPY